MKTPERITDINQLKQGDWIFTVQSGKYELIMFREIHPTNPAYSLFMDNMKDGMPKFYNDDLKKQEYYRYDGSKECWDFIHQKQIEWHQYKIECLKKR